jgi:metal-responsive CopG/Arc/MetJ family transcriptional regulator
MKRATVTFPDALEQKLEAYLAQQRTPPSLSTVVQVALNEYLENQKWTGLEATPATAPLELPVSLTEVEHDLSANHDQYLAESIYEKKVGKAGCQRETNSADIGKTETFHD